MKKFLLLLHEDAEQLRNLSPREMQDLVNAHMKWSAEISASGHMLAGEGLVDESMTISGKNSVVKDGFFLETKEIIGGFYLIQAASLKEALEIAKGCPCHQWGGTTEVRPVMEYDE